MSILSSDKMQPYHHDRGFIFAFKVYQGKKADCLSSSKSFVDCIENIVSRVTCSDIIHVEIIPVIRHVSDREMIISSKAYSAYVGQGFNVHDSSFCTSDPNYTLVYIPMDNDTTVMGQDFLDSQHGKKYNYSALPLTILPAWCKRCKVELEENADPVQYELLNEHNKVFCSQLGLSLCYHCKVFSMPREDRGRFYIDPNYCSPAELYKMLMHMESPIAGCEPIAWDQNHIIISDENM